MFATLIVYLIEYDSLDLLSLTEYILMWTILYPIQFFLALADGSVSCYVCCRRCLADNGQLGTCFWRPPMLIAMHLMLSLFWSQSKC